VRDEPNTQPVSKGPAISILMPTYNSGRYLVEAVESVVHQLRADNELLIQDGASKDGSIQQIMELYEAEPSVKIVSAPDDGQSDALNKALDRAANPVIGWLNGDDIYYPGALDAARQGWLQDPSADLVYGGWTLFGENGEIKRVCSPAPLTHAGLVRLAPQIYTGAMYMRADTVRQVGGFDAELTFCMDLDLIARILRLGKHPTLVPETLGGFRWYGGSKIGALLDFGVVKEGFIVRQRYAVGFSEHAEAYFFTGMQGIVHVTIPIRRSKLYSKLRVRRDKARRAAELSAS